MKIVNKIKRINGEMEQAREAAQLRTQGTVRRQIRAKYAEYYQSAQVDKQLILYESNWGRGICDNPYALFLAILSDPGLENFRHVWVVDESSDNSYIMSLYEKNPRVSFVKLESDEYLNMLASAGYLISNSTFPNYFIKKKEQIYINTWHGTPLKTMGYDIPGAVTEVRNTIRNFFASDYLLSANDILSSMYYKSYKLEGIMAGEIVEEGYPRNDLTTSARREEVVLWLKSLGIDLDPDKEIILYAPTWRQGMDTQVAANPGELLELKESLEAAIDTERYQILVKPHHYTYELLKERKEYKGLLVPGSIDTNTLLSAVDILISDYSSIFLDFLVTNRPILFYIPDARDYQECRGLYRSLDELPGPYSDKLEDIADMINSLDQVRTKYEKVYQAMKEEICCYEDGKVSERIVDIIWHGKTDYRKIVDEHKKKRMLISGGHMLRNGISHSFLSLLKQIDYEEWDVTAFVEAGDKSQDVLDMINNDMDPRCRAISRVGTFVATYQEEVNRQFVMKRACYKWIWRRYYPETLYAKEWKRCFGDSEFDYIVDFSGYTTFFTPMLLCGKAKEHSVWLHNDIQADMNRKIDGKFPLKEKLNFIISLYPKYDRLVSCGRAVMKTNRKKLATEKTHDRFTYAKNTVDADRIRQMLEHEHVISFKDKEYLIKNQIAENANDKQMELIGLPEKKYMNFVTMGRMSVEKNHEALLDGFSRFYKEHSNARLYLIGEGPLRSSLEKQIARLQLGEAVILTGNIANPFSIMKRCDCFILPSIHEGQPLVLLEARACGLPIIVSNFSTVKESLYPDGQLVIEPTADGVYEGLCAFAEGNVPTCAFSLEEYNQEAYNEFITAVSGLENEGE